MRGPRSLGSYGVVFATVLFLSAAHLGIAFADTVVPSDRVTSRVIVREHATTASADRGSLSPGDTAEFISAVPSWYFVRLADGTEGFVSKTWTLLISESAATFILDAFDVGTGLAVLVRGGDFTLLYDGGSNDDLARGDDNRLLASIRSVAPDLTTIDHVILSHPHRDHVEHLPDIVATYQILNVWDSGALNPICGYRVFLTGTAAETGVAYHTAIQDFGARIVSFEPKTCYGEDLPAESISIACASRITNDPVSLGAGASMTFLHADGSAHSSFNENSLVVRLDLGEKRVLLTGDAEAGGRNLPSTAPSHDSIEGILLDCCPDDIRADLLVVGHHGSMTSSRTTFLDAVNAEKFIVSSGPMKYGSVVLPDAEVLGELESRGEVFRTDLHDGTCGSNAAKVGPDNDGKAGGCDNVRVTIGPGSSVLVKYSQDSD